MATKIFEKFFALAGYEKIPQQMDPEKPIKMTFEQLYGGSDNKIRVFLNSQKNIVLKHGHASVMIYIPVDGVRLHAEPNLRDVMGCTADALSSVNRDKLLIQGMWRQGHPKLIVDLVREVVLRRSKRGRSFILLGRPKD